jgi:hypothetical protein
MAPSGEVQGINCFEAGYSVLLRKIVLLKKSGNVHTMWKYLRLRSVISLKLLTNLYEDLATQHFIKILPAVLE